jgi:hypothetical protein
MINYTVRNEENGRLSVTACLETQKLLDNPIETLVEIKRIVTDKLAEEVCKEYKKEILSKIDKAEIESLIKAKVLKKLLE